MSRHLFVGISNMLSLVLCFMVTLLLCACSSRKEVVRDTSISSQATQASQVKHTANKSDSIRWGMELMLDSLEVIVERPVVLHELRDSVLTERVTIRGHTARMSSSGEKLHSVSERFSRTDSTTETHAATEKEHRQSESVSVAVPSRAGTILEIIAALVIFVFSAIQLRRLRKL